MKHLLPLLFLAVSCATAKKKAIELSEKGRHEEAINHWVKALKEDPDDNEAKEGLRGSLEVVSNDKLTRIRDQRLANQYQGAIEELKNLTDLQKKFQIKLDFNSSTFQGKEIQYLWPHYKESIHHKIKNNLPLFAEADQKDYENVFSSMQDWNQLQSKVKINGHTKCLTLKKQGHERPFYQSFVSQFCKYWGTDKELTKNTISSVLFSKVQTEALVTNLNDISQSALEAAINKSLAESPWYHPEATKVIKIKLSGNYDWTSGSQTVKQVHNYKARVPYTDYEVVKRAQQVPYSATENGMTVTKYRTEFHKVKEPVTRYRDEARIYEYFAKKNTLALALNMKGTLEFDKRSEPFSYVKNETEEKILHDINIPSIGLHPQTIDVGSPLSKFEVYSADVSQKFRSEMDTIWKKTYCTLPNDRQMTSVGENVIRCQRLAVYPEEFVNSWFKNHFGVTLVKAKDILGSF